MIHNTALYLGMAADVTGRLHVGDAIISVDGVDLRDGLYPDSIQIGRIRNRQQLHLGIVLYDLI